MLPVACFTAAMSPVGGGMWGIFRKPLKRAFQTCMGQGGYLRVKKKVVGRRSWAVLGFSPIFGVVFGGFQCRTTRAHYPKPCSVNSFLMRSAS